MDKLDATQVPPSSSPPAPVDLEAQLRAALLVLRDTLFELQELTTRLGDVVHNLHQVLGRIDGAVARAA